MKFAMRRPFTIVAVAVGLSLCACGALAQLPQAGPIAPQAPVEPPASFEPPPSIDPHRPAQADLQVRQAAAPWSAPSSDSQFVDRYGAGRSGAAREAGPALAQPVPQAVEPAQFAPAALAATTSAAPTVATSPAGEPILRGCVVKFTDKILVSVQEAGLITALEVREGMMVEADALVGRVSDGQARMAKLVAEAEHKIARDKASNDIEVRYAESAAKVAEFEYRAALQANERAPASISQVKLQELALAYEKAQRQIEQAKHNLEIFKEECEAKRVEVEAADDGVRRRQITSPIAGEVVEVPVHIGEYVQPGDPIFQVVRLDTLAVEGFLSAENFAPGEVVNKPVVVDAVLAHGRRAQFAGKIVFAHPEIDARRQFRIKAEITNVAENGHYLLHPGQEVDMLIRHDASPAQPPTDPSLATPGLPERR